MRVVARALTRCRPACLRRAVSKRALGVVSGFVGAGGNTVAAILQYIFFTHSAVWINEAVRERAHVLTRAHPRYCTQLHAC